MLFTWISVKVFKALYKVQLCKKKFFKCLLINGSIILKLIFVRIIEKSNIKDLIINSSDLNCLNEPNQVKIN